MISSTPLRLRDPEGYTAYSASAPEGYFFLYQPRGDGVLNTFHCREELASMWDDDHARCRYLGFMWTNRIWVGRTERMWRQFETAMGVTEPTVFHGICDEDGDVETGQVLLHLSPFWVKTQTHRSVCSLLLRLLIVHYTDSWNAAVNAYALARDCKLALEWFLAGNTRPTYRDWESEDEKAREAYDKVMDKHEKACLKIDESSDPDRPYPDGPEEPISRVGEYGYGFYGMYADRPIEETRRLLVKP